MFWFLPLLAGIGGLIGYLGGYLIEKWVISYLDKEGAKERIQEQKEGKQSQKVNRLIGGMIRNKFEEGKAKNCSIGLESSLEEVDWVLEDEKSSKLFAGKYYNGEVVSMEEIVAEEIDPELQQELDTQEIVIL